jgi:hypothetical protein
MQPYVVCSFQRYGYKLTHKNPIISHSQGHLHTWMVKFGGFNPHSDLVSRTIWAKLASSPTQTSTDSGMDDSPSIRHHVVRTAPLPGHSHPLQITKVSSSFSGRLTVTDPRITPATTTLPAPASSH